MWLQISGELTITNYIDNIHVTYLIQLCHITFHNMNTFYFYNGHKLQTCQVINWYNESSIIIVYELWTLITFSIQMEKYGKAQVWKMDLIIY